MSMMSLALLPFEGGHGSGEHEAVWVLPMSIWAYGGIALGAFLLLLLIAWFFRNSGHTLMTGPDVVDHGSHGHTVAPRHAQPAAHTTATAHTATTTHAGTVTHTAAPTDSLQDGHGSSH